MMADELLNAQDLITAKKHDTFHSEVVTGKAGGLSTGANIDYAINAVTGQVQKTLPATVNGIDWTPVGNLTTDNCTFTKPTDYAVDDSGTQWAYNGTFPFTSTAPVVPSAPDYYVVHVGSLQALSGLTNPSGLDQVYCRTFNSVVSMQSGSGFFIGQSLKVQGEGGTFINYEVVNSPSDVDLGGGLWAKELSTSTANVSHEGKNAFNFIDALSKKKLTLPDLISKMQSLVTIHDMYARAEGGELFVGYVMGDKSNPAYLFVVEYRFAVNGDGLLLLLGSASAPASFDSSRRVADEFTINSGTINTSSAPSSYASTVGTTLTGTYTGNSFNFRSLNDNRGGVWSVRLESSKNKFEKNISTWNSVSSGTAGFIQEVFSNIPYDTYNYTLKFLGDDPNHVPSGGAGASRGWIYHTPANTTQQPVVLSKSPIINTSARKWLLPSNTILDFAISARRAGTSDAYQWVPVHSGVTGVSDNISYKLIVDGQTLSTSAGLVPDIPFHSVKSVNIVQRFSAKNPAEPLTELWKHYVTHSLTNDGILTISNRAEFTQNTDVGLGYLGMLAAVTSNHDRVVFNNGQEQSPLLADGSNVYSTYGWDSVMYGGVYDVATGINHGCAATVDWSDAANAFNELQPDETLRQHWRSDSDITKTYWTALRNATTGTAQGPVPVGKVIKNKTTYFCVSGVRNPNTSLKPV